MAASKNQIKFGTDGWRGIVGKDFKLGNVRIVAQAISDYFRRDGQSPCIAVGYDTRKLSRESAMCMARVFAGNGIKVFLSDRAVPSQTVSYTVRYRKCAAGVMVTASHNPPRYNGIKIKGGFGGPVGAEVTGAIEQFLFRSKLVEMTLPRAGQLNLVKSVNLMNDYLSFLRTYLDMAVFNKAPLNILVDSMHGTGTAYIAGMLQGTRVKVTTVHARRDCSFGGVNPEPVAGNLKQTARLMRRGGYDVCLVTDGDADRVAALDAAGEFISPQQIIALLLLHLLRYRKMGGGVVKTISGTAILEQIAQKYNLKVYETPVGFKHISSLMEKEDILIGGEEGGGIGVKNYLPERDGLLAGLLLLEMMLVNNKPIAELLKEMAGEFGQYVYLRKDITYTLNEKPEIAARFEGIRNLKTFAGQEVARIKDYDGIKLCLANGEWILFRLSGTEPLTRIYAESSSREETERLIEEGKKLLLKR